MSTLAVGTRVETTDTPKPCPGTVTKVPDDYWLHSDTHVRRLPPGIVWVQFDDNGGAPWGVDGLRIIDPEGETA